MKKNILETKSFDFALLSISLSKELVEKKEFVMSRQLMRSGTSIGANIRESQRAESRRDFIHKLSISLKECNEAKYWIELLHASDYIEAEQFAIFETKCVELLKLLTSSIKTAKRNMN